MHAHSTIAQQIRNVSWPVTILFPGWSASIKQEHLSHLNGRLLKQVALPEAVNICFDTGTKGVTSQ